MDKDVFQNALAAISEGVLVAGADQRILSCNRGFTEITGFTEQDMIGKTCRCLQGPETSVETVDAIHRALKNQVTFSGEILNYRKSGERFWNDLGITPVLDDNQKLTHYIGIIRDVTERKAAREKLVSLEETYRFLFDHVQAGIVLHSADTAVLYANATAIRLLGAASRSIEGALHTDPRWIFVREDGSPMPIEEYPVSRAVATESVIKSVVIGLHRSDGKDITWVMCNAYPVRDELGRLDRVVVSFTDITEFKQTELALHRSEERLRLVLSGANDAAWDWDMVTGKAYYSPRWWQMLGDPPSEGESDPKFWLKRMHPRDRRLTEAALRQALAGDMSTYEIEFRLRHRDGHWVPVLSRGFILRDSSGTPIRLSGTNMDLSDRKKAEKQIYKLAFYDALTGLPNRQMLTETLRKILQSKEGSGHQGALLILDVDDFKTLNDTRGHDVGDMLLVQVAKRLRAWAATNLWWCWKISGWSPRRL